MGAIRSFRYGSFNLQCPDVCLGAWLTFGLFGFLSVLRTLAVINIEQEHAYGDLIISKGPRYESSLNQSQGGDEEREEEQEEEENGKEMLVVDEVEVDREEPADHADEEDGERLQEDEDGEEPQRRP